MQTSSYGLGLALLSAVGCGGSGGSGHLPAADMSSTDGAAKVVGQHGVVIDYFKSKPLAGFTVTDGSNSTTTDASGYFLLPAPLGVASAPTVTGPMYTTLHLPEAMASEADADRGAIPIPSAADFSLEQSVLGNDQTQALVYITVIKTGACTAIAGGTVTVTSPAGAAVKYFTTQGLPTATAFTEVDGTLNKPAAVVYNIPPGQEVELTINHPTCKPVAKGQPHGGLLLTGHVATVATEPGDHNASLVFVVE